MPDRNELTENALLYPLSSSPLLSDPAAHENPFSQDNVKAEAASPLHSHEAFETYCAQVQSRLAASAARRQRFLQEAYDRLTRLLHAARAVEDASLAQELAQQRLVVQELLASLPRSASRTDGSVSEAPTLLYDAAARKAQETAGSAPPGTPVMVDSVLRGMAPPPSARDSFPDRAVVTSLPPRLPRRAVRPLADIEVDAARLRAELSDWASRHALTTETGEPHAPNCLLLRALACRQRRLESEAGDAALTPVVELGAEIAAMLRAANDQEYSIAFDEELDPPPTAYQWGELAERYEEMARAEEAFLWWRRHRNELAVADVQALAEAIAAIQQRFNRLLFRVGARDPFQQQLFDDLRAWAREAQCYLHSLRPKVPIVELVERAGALDAAWERAREALTAAQTRRQAVEKALAMVSHPDFGTQPEQDADRLCAVLLESKMSRLPASERRLRDALLPWGAFLEGEEALNEILREIHLEWERRLDTGQPSLEMETAPENASEIAEEELTAVRAMTRGKHGLILGGVSLEEQRRHLEALLELDALIWSSVPPSDPGSNLETDVARADIVILLMRFGHKEWRTAQEQCVRAGKPCALLLSGADAGQFVHHLFQQICAANATD